MKEKLNFRDWFMVNIIVQEGLIFVFFMTIVVILSQYPNINKYIFIPLILNIIYLIFIKLKLRKFK